MQLNNKFNKNLKKETEKETEKLENSSKYKNPLLHITPLERAFLTTPIEKFTNENGFWAVRFGYID